MVGRQVSFMCLRVRPLPEEKLFVGYLQKKKRRSYIAPTGAMKEYSAAAFYAFIHVCFLEFP
jgi:hypothetical protein